MMAPLFSPKKEKSTTNDMNVVIMPEGVIRPGKGHYLSDMFLRPDQILVDERYQRKLEPERVAKMEKEFNYDVFNRPKVSLRADGKYYVFDGQHSVELHKRHEGENAPIKCQVYVGLTWEEEKNLFVAQNGKFAKAVTKKEKIRAEKNSPGSDVQAMVKACEERGLRVDFEYFASGADMQCCAPNALYDEWKSLGKDVFCEMIDLIIACWDGHYMGFYQGFIKGFGYIFKHFYGKFENEEFRKSISKNAPEYYIREAKEIMKGTQAKKYATVLCNVYNCRRRGSNRLELNL